MEIQIPESKFTPFTSHVIFFKIFTTFHRKHIFFDGQSCWRAKPRCAYKGHDKIIKHEDFAAPTCALLGLKIMLFPAVFYYIFFEQYKLSLYTKTLGTWLT